MKNRFEIITYPYIMDHARRWTIACMLLLLVALSLPGAASPAEESVKLPETAGDWRRTNPITIRPDAIFDYMDGAGELYMAYGFLKLDVFRYAARGREGILVEIYHMPSPDDAWGLLSGDWGGEPTPLGEAKPAGNAEGKAPAARALYGNGLLRLAAGSIYARVLAERETDASRRAVLHLGAAIAEGQPLPPPPRLVSALPRETPAGAELLPERVVFFHSHLVLNSVYYLSSSNLLRLDGKTEAVIAGYKQPSTDVKAHLLLVAYPDSGSAEKAQKSFVEAYLPELKGQRYSGHQAAKVEDGWVAFERNGHWLAIAFRADSLKIADELVMETLSLAKTMEGKKDEQ